MALLLLFTLITKGENVILLVNVCSVFLQHVILLEMFVRYFFNMPHGQLTVMKIAHGLG